MVSATWTSIHQGWTDYSHYWMLNQAGAENNTEHLLWHHSSGEWASYQICRLSTLDCFHHGRDNLTGIDMYSGYRFAFSICNASANSAIHLHIECTALSTAFHKYLLQIKEHTSQQKKCGNWPMLCDSLFLPNCSSSWSTKVDGMLGCLWNLKVNIPRHLWKCRKHKDLYIGVTGPFYIIPAWMSSLLAFCTDFRLIVSTATSYKPCVWGEGGWMGVGSCSYTPLRSFCSNTSLTLSSFPFSLVKYT